jgi:hypothetical protein
MDEAASACKIAMILRCEQSFGTPHACRPAPAGVRSTFGPVLLAYEPKLKVGFARLGRAAALCDRLGGVRYEDLILPAFEDLAGARVMHPLDCPARPGGCDGGRFGVDSPATFTDSRDAYLISGCAPPRVRVRAAKADWVRQLRQFRAVRVRGPQGDLVVAVQSVEEELGAVG